MNRKTVYLAGPMRGKPDYNIPAFNVAEVRLVAQGWRVVNPVHLSEEFGVLAEPDNGRLLRAVMDAELAVIPRLDAIYLLRGWERSEGAKKELEVALEWGLMVMVEGEA